MRNRQERYEELLLGAVRLNLAAHRAAYRERDVGKAQVFVADTVIQLQIAEKIGEAIIIEEQ